MVPDRLDHLVAESLSITNVDRQSLWESEFDIDVKWMYSTDIDVKAEAEHTMATIYDVAEAAGVSPKTVSRVLNDEPHVRESTRQKVLEAVEALDYRANLSARQMRTQKSQVIALISDEIAATPYAVDLIKGALKKGREHRKSLLIVNTERDPEIKQEAVELMLERQVEGIIYAAMFHRPVSPPASMREVPTVLLDCFVEDRSLPSVVPDEVNGGYVATKMLLNRGHRRIGLINNAESIPAEFGRLAGYQQALAEFNIPFDPDLVANYQPPDAESGYRGTMQLLTRPSRPTALFCFNDRMAAGAYQALRELELLIPDDVAVIGFDNQVDVTTSLYPSLTSLQLPHYEMGQWAVEQLLQLINNPDEFQNQAPVQHKIKCPLVERDST